MGVCSSKDSVDAKAGQPKAADKAASQEEVMKDVATKSVEKIWVKYDADGNGTLDYTEMEKFVKETIAEM